MFVPTGTHHLIIHANGCISLFVSAGAQISLSHQRALIRISLTPTGAYHRPDLAFSPYPSIVLPVICAASHQVQKSKHCAASHHAQNQSIAPTAIGHEIQLFVPPAIRCKSKHCTASHWVQNQSIALPSGTQSKHRATIRLYFKALRHQPSGANSKHCASSHQALIPSIALPAIRRKIQALRRQPSGPKLKRCAASHRAQNQGIVLPAIGQKIKALRCQPLGAKSKHCASSHRVQN